MKLVWWNKYACPKCKADLESSPPVPMQHPWYKVVLRATVQCPACKAGLYKRFAVFDIGMLLFLAGSGAISLWGSGKIVLKIVALVLLLRFVLSWFLSVYVPAKK